jgi:hypothetical protein
MGPVSLKATLKTWARWVFGIFPGLVSWKLRGFVKRLGSMSGIWFYLSSPYQPFAIPHSNYKLPHLEFQPVDSEDHFLIVLTFFLYLGLTGR